MVFRCHCLLSSVRLCGKYWLCSSPIRFNGNVVRLHQDPGAALDDVCVHTGSYRPRNNRSARSSPDRKSGSWTAQCIWSIFKIKHCVPTQGGRNLNEQQNDLTVYPSQLQWNQIKSKKINIMNTVWPALLFWNAWIILMWRKRNLPNVSMRTFSTKMVIRTCSAWFRRFCGINTFEK